jgi:hypothetical protein
MASYLPDAPSSILVGCRNQIPAELNPFDRLIAAGVDLIQVPSCDAKMDQISPSPYKIPRNPHERELAAIDSAMYLPIPPALQPCQS